MPYLCSLLFTLQCLFLYCHASLRFAVRDAHPRITSAPALGAAPENELLRRQDACTWACAVCAMYTPCGNCTSLSPPVGIECCTSKLADPSACPTGSVPPQSTIYIYTLGSLTLFGNPTSLVVGSNTLTPGGTPATAGGYTLSVPTTATGGGIVEDGTTTALGSPISTVVGTGTIGSQNTDTSTNTITDTNTNPNINTGTNLGEGTVTVTVGTNTGTTVDTNTSTAETGTVTGSDTNTSTNTHIGTATATDINTNTNAGTNTGIGTDTATGINTNPNGNSSPQAGTGTATSVNTNTNAGTNTQTGASTGAGTNIQTGTGTDTGVNINTNTNPPAPLSTYAIGGIPFTGNPTSLVAGTVTLTPGGSSLTSSGHTIAIPTSATDGQIQIDGTATPLPRPNTARDTGTGTVGTITGTTPGTGTGTNAGTVTGTVTGTGTGTGTVPRTSYGATNVATGLPWGVMLTTVSGKPYTLTWVGSKISAPTTFIETGPSTTETTSQTAGGFIWTVPTLPPGFPDPLPGPPPGFPDPLGGGIDPDVLGCIFGCGPPGLGGINGGGGGLPCLIDCGGGGGKADPDPTDPSPTDPNPSSPTSPTNTEATQTRTTNSHSTNTVSSCASSAFPSCTQVISVSSSMTITSTSCITITGCSGTATTGISSVTSSATGAYCSIGCPGCGAAASPKRKRDKPLRIERRLATPKDYRQNDLANRGLLTLREDYMQYDVWKRGYVALPSDSDFANNMNQFITEEITNPGARPVPMPRMNPVSTAIKVLFDAPPNESNYYPSVVGLEGCTSIVIIGEHGCWVSHFWESPWFLGVADNPTSGMTNFQDNVITPLENGNGNNMPSPFAAGGQTNRISELADGANGYKPEIIILTLMDNGKYTYDPLITLMEQALTGEGKAFAGCTVDRRGYVRQEPDASSAKGKILIQYTNDQQDKMGVQLFCPQQAIYKVWFEENKISEHSWPAVGNQIAGGTGNQKRQNGACTVGQSGSGIVTATGTSAGGTNTAGTNTGGTNTNTNTQTNINTNTGTNSGFSTSVIRSSNTITNGPTLTSGTGATGSSASHSPTSSYICYPFEDPDAGPAAPQCECDGLDDFYPYLSSTSGQSNYNPCGYTTSPTTATATSVPGFTTTESDGKVVSCASSAYYNYAVNTNPTCAGTTQVVSTVASIASVYSASVASVASAASVASVSSASAAAWSSTAAVPSAACWILDDDGFGDSTFEVYGINGWAGDDGSKFWDQENGCGILSGQSWHTDGQSEFEGQVRDTQYAYFGLSFFKGGCVERAVHSAGGPPPGTGPDQMTCQHVPSSLNSDQLAAVNSISGPQLKAVQAVADSTPTTGTFQNTVEDEVVQPGESPSVSRGDSQPNVALVASASAALPHLLAAASAVSTAPGPTSA